MSESTGAIQQQIRIPMELAGQRLDRALATLLPDYSRSLIKQWIDAQYISLNGNFCAPKTLVAENDDISINAPLPTRTELAAQAIALDIVHEDDTLLIVNKPAGLVVHPGSGNADGTLVNALLHHAPSLQALPRAGLIHRIDKETTGLLVIAKTLAAHTELVAALQKRLIRRQYHALVQGELISGGTIDTPIGRHPKQRTKMAVVPQGKPAVTHYRIAERLDNYTLLTLRLETGRTHQLRVHMAHLGYPIVGDPVYNPRLRLPKKCSDAVQAALQTFKRQALHAYQLGLTHPQTKKNQEWTAPMPQDMLKLIETIRNG